MTTFTANVYRTAHDENTNATDKLKMLGSFKDRAIELFVADMRQKFLKACIATCEHWIDKTYPDLLTQTEQEIKQLDTRVGVLKANLEKTRKRKISDLDEADQLREDIEQLEREITSAEGTLQAAHGYLEHTLPALLADRQQDLEIYTSRLADEPPLLGSNGNGNGQ